MKRRIGIAALAPSLTPPMIALGEFSLTHSLTSLLKQHFGITT
jgi:hypothetical protein